MVFGADYPNSKNLRVQMGRCPVRSIFPEALAMLEKKQDKLGYAFSTHKSRAGSLGKAWAFLPSCSNLDQVHV